MEIIDRLRANQGIQCTLSQIPVIALLGTCDKGKVMQAE